MRYSLSDLYRRTKNPRRSIIPLRPISAPSTRAADLYRSSYLPTVQLWQNALERILAEYERSLAQVTTDSAESLSTVIGQVEQDSNDLTATVRIRLTRWAERLEQWHRGRWRKSIQAATGLDLGMMIGPSDMRETIATVIERNVSLVSSVSNQTRERISDAVFRGLTAKRPVGQVAKEIREAVAMSRRRARNIAADQLSTMNAALNSERRREAGIGAWEWIHSEKARPRPEHVARNGLLYSEVASQQGTTYEGKTVRKPPESKPGQEPYCGCIERAVLLL